jgi:hypothetical protein
MFPRRRSPRNHCTGCTKDCKCFGRKAQRGAGRVRVISRLLQRIYGGATFGKAAVKSLTLPFTIGRLKLNRILVGQRLSAAGVAPFGSHVCGPALCIDCARGFRMLDSVNGNSFPSLRLVRRLASAQRSIRLCFRAERRHFRSAGRHRKSLACAPLQWPFLQPRAGTTSGARAGRRIICALEIGTSNRPRHIVGVRMPELCR